MEQLRGWTTVVVLFNSIMLLDGQSYIGSGSSVPLFDGDADLWCSDNPGHHIADSRSLCWFFKCRTAHGSPYKVSPMRCGLGSYVSEGFQRGPHNPCTERFPILGIYDCTRKSNTPDKNCTGLLMCKNGGTPQQEGTICWCKCPPQYQGEADCSKFKGATPLPQGGGPCLRNGCNSSTCLNGGTCNPDCAGGFSCTCPVPYTKTRRCEQFNCETTNFTCPDVRDSCTRGLYGSDEFYVCRRNDRCGDYIKPWPQV